MTDPAFREALRADHVRAQGVLTSEQLDQLAAKWRRAQHGRPRLLTPLPPRVRLRLAATRIIDREAIRLIGRGHYRAAGWLWPAIRKQRK